MVAPGAGNAPVFDGRGATFLDYEHQVHLWMRAAKTGLAGRASLLALRMQPAPSQVCLAAGSDILTRIVDILRSYSDPGTADAIRQRVARFTNYRRTDQSGGENIAEFDLLLREAESRMEVYAGYPGKSASILRMCTAGLPLHEKSWIMASCHKSLKFEDAPANMRRLFGSRGGGRRQDALFT